MVVSQIVCETQGRPVTRGCPGQAKIWLPSKPIFFQLFGLGQGWRTFLRVHVHIAGNLRKNSFACGKPLFTSTVFPIFPWHRSVQVGVPCICSVGPTIIPALVIRMYFVCRLSSRCSLSLSLHYQFKSTFIVRAPKLICALVQDMYYTGPVSFVAIVPQTKPSLLPKVNSYTQLVLHFITTYCS
jgi:hypothetical protein